ncbi:hypothetical protein [Cytobacillus praedii]|uniref:Uncharacterized protein n=1 Tax=Cytobacillus praedii TaxID=1742358 RepID=A0A4R1ASP2_9BACI|nr:hypothetical protein [Cytobacillus praedii]TCJ01120.1 hypothetical protein E0Y62_25615 [Cytobacillus praedii]
MASNTQNCTCCGKSKKLSDYYASNSPFHKITKKLHVCKPCIWDFASGVTEADVERVKDIVRRIDKPFLLEYWQSAIEESNNDNKDLFKVYMKNLGMRQNIDKTWADSDLLTANDELITTEKSDSGNTSTENIVEHKKKWGTYNEVDYEYLENFYGEYKNSYATDTPVQINLYRNIAKVHLQAEKELSNGNTKAFKDLMELSSKLHNDGNIKPIQSTGANDDKGLSTYGLWIKTVEQDEPCEYFEDKPLYEDYDKLKKYWEKWFVRPFKNIFNISKDFDVRDDD